MEPKLIYQTKPDFISVYCAQPNPYFYSERNGKDSVAVLLYSATNMGYDVLTRIQPMPQFRSDVKVRCPITGSMDGKSVQPIFYAMSEAYEEGGYKLNPHEFADLGRYIVGTQTNEVCYIFAADVSDKQQQSTKGDGTVFENLSSNEWVDIRDCLNTQYSGLEIAANRLFRHLK